MPLNFDYQKKKAPTNRLQVYSLLASATLLTSGATNASVVYTDLSPDKVLINETAGVDFDGDGIDDFLFNHVGFGTISSLQLANFYFEGEEKGVMLTTSTVSGIPLFKATGALFSGDTIDSSKCFFSGTDYYGTGPFGGGVLARYTNTPSFMSSFGPFLGVTDRFLGVKFPIGTDVHFGWIRLSAPANASSLTIQDFAYEDSPGVGIAAGAGIPLCSSAVAPDNLVATVGGGAVTFDWDVVPMSVGCQIVAGPVGSGFPFERNVAGVSLTGTGPIPLGAVPPGNYQAKVRCVCSISPLDPTAFSDTVLFTVPTPRLESAPSIEWAIGPNPAFDALMVSLKLEKACEIAVRIFGLDGREIYFHKSEFARGSYSLDFDVSEFPAGSYILQLAMNEETFTEQFKIAR